MAEFKSWRDIMAWAEERGFKNIVKRMEMNNKYWNSCGEFGRSQVAICDALRFAEDEDERVEIAERMEQELASDEIVKYA